MAQRAAIASRLTQLTDISRLPVLLKDTSPQDPTSASQAAPKPSKLVSMLRSAVLVSKLATLTFSVQADLLGHSDPEMPTAVQGLWCSMRAAALHILEAITESGGTSACSDRGGTETGCFTLSAHCGNLTASFEGVSSHNAEGCVLGIIDSDNGCHESRSTET